MLDPDLIVLKISDIPTGGISHLEIQIQYAGEILPGYFIYDTMKPLDPENLHTKTE